MPCFIGVLYGNDFIGQNIFFYLCNILKNMYSVQKIEYIDTLKKDNIQYQSWWSKIQKACETECDQATWAEIRKKI